MVSVQVERDGRWGVDYASLRARRAELDWLLVDKCVLHGERHSLRRLWLMRDCCAVANALNRSGRVEVCSMVINNDWVAVRVTRRDSEGVAWWYFRRVVADACLSQYDAELSGMLDDLRLLHMSLLVSG